ncbi:MAG: S4 domain-containing protein [Pseudomonadota bacterium]|nr:S4 domain-containing protein [Pseudomonadota bacterium]
MADAGANGTMRLDRFLWHARLARTRSAAHDFACAGRLRLDGRAIERAATPVRVGNILTFALGQHIRVIRIEALPTRRGPPAEARACYQDLAIANASQQAAEIDEADRGA